MTCWVENRNGIVVRVLKHTHAKMSDEDVLRFVAEGRWAIDTDAGTVTRRNGDAVTVTEDDHGSLFVQLYADSMRRTISLGLLVWMTRTKTVLPPAWEVHHWNKIKSDCRWENLLAVHHLDHDKFHEPEKAARADRVPF